MAVYVETGLAVTVTVSTVERQVNPLTLARQALWTKLEADADFAGLVLSRNRFKYDNDSFLPEEVHRQDCPCFAIVGGSIPEEWVTESKQELRYRLECVGYTASASPTDAEQLYWSIKRALMRNWPGLGLSNIHDMDFSPPAIRIISVELGRPDIWQLRFQIVLTIRDTVK